MIKLSRNTKLLEFKKLSKEDQINKVNNILKGLDKPTFTEAAKVLGFSNVGQFFKGYYISTITKQLEPREITESQVNLSQEEILFLKNMILKLKNNENIKQYNEGEIITRSIRVNKDVMTAFTEYCDKMGLKQVYAISQALMDFINR